MHSLRLFHSKCTQLIQFRSRDLIEASASSNLHMAAMGTLLNRGFLLKTITIMTLRLNIIHLTDF